MFGQADGDMTRAGYFIARHRGKLSALLLLLLAAVFLGRALWPPAGQALGAHDTRGLFAPWFRAIRGALADGRLPWWDPYQFAGYPFLSNPQVAFFYPPTWLGAILPANLAISWYVLLHLWLAAVGMYLFARTMGGRWLGAMLAAVVYAFSGFFAARLWAGHIGLVATFTWLPWVILATRWSFSRGDLWAAVVAGAPVGLAILAGHTPSFLIIGAIWLAFALYFFSEGRGRRRLLARQAAVMALVGAGLAAVQLLPFAQLSLASQRLAGPDFDFASAFSLPPAHLVTLLLPEFFGEPTQIGYWSVPTFEELSYYAGLLVLFAIVLALRKQSRLAWFYLVLIVAGLWLALGRYSALYRAAYELLPVVQWLRAPARWAAVYVFAGAALLADALGRWQGAPEAERSQDIRRLARGSLLVVGLAGVAAVAAAGAVFMAVHPTDTSGRLWHQIGGYALAVAVLVLGIGAIWGLLATPETAVRRRRLLAAALLIVAVADMWQFGAKLMVVDDSGPSQMWRDAKAIIGDSPELVVPWGVSIFDQSGSMDVGLRSVFGYQALEPEAMVAFTSHVADPRSSAYDVLGARYVVAPVALDQFTEGEAGLSLAGQQGAAWVYRRPWALDVARLAFKVEVIEDAGRAIERVHEADFDPLNTAILDSDPGCPAGPEVPAERSVTIEAMRAGYWRLRTRSDAPGILVLAESDFGGWQAAVDGQAGQHLRAFTTIRAVCVPAGEHVVEWTYRPVIFMVGGVVSAVSLILVIGGALAIRRRRIARRQDNASLTNWQR
jgi:hypothetical protein